MKIQTHNIFSCMKNRNNKDFPLICVNFLHKYFRIEKYVYKTKSIKSFQNKTVVFNAWRHTEVL